jgi:hypothetical protein
MRGEKKMGWPWERKWKEKEKKGRKPTGQEKNRRGKRKKRKREMGRLELWAQEGFGVLKTFSIFLICFKFKFISNSNEFYSKLKLKHSIKSK